MSARDVVVFLGPSLPVKEAGRVLPARFLPPARQGDVFRVLVDRPKVIVLIDGVFEAVPSVWHHELRAALASGVHVIGAASMGALRAAELHHEGMIPVGTIAGDYVRGSRTDDADVVLLHGDGDSGWRPLTVPLVTIEATLKEAVRRRRLSRALARTLSLKARSLFYKERTWRAVVGALAPSKREAALQIIKAHVIDPKALDTRRALEVAGLLRRHPARPVRCVQLSSFVRRRRLIDAYPEQVRRLEARPDAGELTERGLRTLLLADFARMAGLEVDVRRSRARRVADDESAAQAETEALEALVLAAPQRFLPDGPSALEGLVFEARRTGLWDALFRR